MTDFKITVYITNYNYAGYIKQAIESVLNQSFQDFELLIIDDGSTDNSKEIIEQYSDDPKIRIIYQKNKGLNITNNIALRLAQGKYIMRLDADDYLDPQALSKMVNALDEDPSLGLVFPDYFLVDKNNLILSEVRRHNFDKEVNLFDQPAHGACTMIRVDFLRELGGYNESYSCQDGYELWIKFISKFKVTNLPEPLFFYRQHGKNLTSNENKILDTRRTINSDFVIRNNIELPSTIGIIPIRDTSINGTLLALVEIDGKSLLEIKLEECLRAKTLHQIVVTSALEEIEKLVLDRYSDNSRVSFVRRTESMSRYNESLLDTLNNVMKHVKSDSNPEAIMVLPIEYIFLSANTINDAVHVLKIFNSNSLISVRPEFKTIYQHHGNGMTPIMDQDKFTQLEREALYRSLGGITLTFVRDFERTQRLISGKVGHIVVDSKTGFGIFSKFELDIAKLMVATDIVV